MPILLRKNPTYYWVTYQNGATIQPDREVYCMQEEAVITINGAKLTDAESMTVRIIARESRIVPGVRSILE